MTGHAESSSALCPRSARRCRRVWRNVVIVSFRAPRRPEPTDPRARRVVEWADVVYYIFWLAFSAIVAVLALVVYGPTIVT